MSLQALKLRYFRNFEEIQLNFKPGKNIIIGKNGVWKTNILEALALPQTHLSEWNPQYLVKKWHNTSSIEFCFEDIHLLYTYSLSENKKRYFLEKKASSLKNIRSKYPHIISFHPQMMDLLYGSPSWRRDFLDSTLSQTYPEYEKVLSHYKKIITARNKILIRIWEWKSHSSELHFWDNQYITSLNCVYAYRDKLIYYLISHSASLKKYFFWKIENIKFQLLSKTPHTNREEYVRSYIEENRNKEIYQRKTLRWPHLDDFEILVDNTSLVHFASRWEVKTILLALKFLCWDFIMKYSEKQDILFLIDDIFSELDTEHMKSIYDYIWERQCIISSIKDIEVYSANKIYF